MKKKVLIYNHLTPLGFSNALLTAGYKMRYNLRSDNVEYSPAYDNIDDRMSQKMRFLIAEKCEKEDKNGEKIPLLYSKAMFFDLRDALLSDNEVDPFKDWLEGLEPLEISSDEIADRSLAIDRLFEDLFGTPADPYYRHAARMIVLSAIYRAYHPGYKIDEVAVLQGGQNVGKDSVIRELLPNPTYFTDALAFNSSDKEKIEVTRGKVLVCASEMGGVTTTRDLEALKRWVSSQADRVRMAYRHDAEDYPRRFVVVGTTNEAKPLPPDATGNRRWIVVPIPNGAHVEPWMQDRREKFWREGMALYRAGVLPNLPWEMKEHQRTINSELKRADDQIEEAYEAWTLYEKPDHPYQGSAIASRLGLVEIQSDWIRAPKADQHRLRDVLISHGWQQSKIRHEGQVRRWWLPPTYISANNVNAC